MVVTFQSALIMSNESRLLAPTAVNAHKMRANDNNTFFITNIFMQKRLDRAEPTYLLLYDGD